MDNGWENRLASTQHVNLMGLATEEERGAAATYEAALGKEPFVICNADEIEEMLNLMGIPAVTINPLNYEIIQQGRAAHYVDVLHQAGFSGPQRFALAFASALDPGMAPRGPMPRPIAIVVGGKFEAELRICELWAKQLGCPVYPMDFMFSPQLDPLPDGWWRMLRRDWDKLIDPHRLALRVEQEREFINFIQRETGRTVSPDAVIEAMERSNLQMDIWSEAQDLIARTKPCPASIRDQVAIYGAMWRRGTQDGLDLITAYRDELRQRVSDAVPAHPGERFRLYYDFVDPPWHEEIARRFGAVTVANAFTGIPDLYARDIKDGDPFPALAGRHVFLYAHSPDRIVEVARQHQCDGAIVIERHMDTGVPSAERKAFEDAGIPYLALPRDAGDEQIIGMIGDFIERRLVARA